MGIANLAGQAPVGLGWYSAWVAILATAFGITNIVRFHDPTIGLLWLQWAVLWALFWLVLGLGVTRLTPLTAWLTLILSFTTCTIPGYLLLLGRVGPGAHLGGAGGHRGDGGRPGPGRDAEPARARGRGRPGRSRDSGLGVLIAGLSPGPALRPGDSPPQPGLRLAAAAANLALA